MTLPLAVDWPVILSSAVVAAVVSTAGSVIAAVVARRTDIDVAKINEAIEAGKIQLSSELAEKSESAKARREYEYDARKRLYAQCEPLLFQSLDLIQGGRRRVESLARSAKSREIRVDGAGWLAFHNYYWQSTVYYLLAPLTSYRILQRRITAIDLRLEPSLQGQYEILRLMFHVFAADFELAKVDGTRYEPDKADEGRPDWESLRRDLPAVYGRQGFYAGTLDTVVERLIAGTDTQRCKSFGEFCADLNDDKPTTQEFVKNVDEVFGGFHPLRKPILWRVLVTEVVLYDAFMAMQSPTEDFARRLTEVAKGFLTDENVAKLDWRESPANSSHVGEVRQPLKIAVDYVSNTAGELSALKPGLS
jgi:hypothetical protein